MAASTPTEFPVVLEKTVDGKTVKRTAHSIIAFNQLTTEGFKDPSARRAPAAKKPAEKPAGKPAEKPAEKQADKTTDK